MSLNICRPVTVALASGPVITSVKLVPSIAIPTTEKVLPDSSPPALVIVTNAFLLATVATTPTVTPFGPLPLGVIEVTEA